MISLSQQTNTVQSQHFILYLPNTYHIILNLSLTLFLTYLSFLNYLTLSPSSYLIPILLPAYLILHLLPTLLNLLLTLLNFS